MIGEPTRPYPAKVAATALGNVRAACLALPRVKERLSHGSPSFFINDKKCFVMFLDNHHNDRRLALWCAAPQGVQMTMVDEDAERFFVPPYVGGRGWLGVRLDRDPDWEEVASIIIDAFRCVAPRGLLLSLGPPEPTDKN